ncbi:MAG: diguanylate cyclase [Thermodesulfobacteriota bacterium]
MKIRYQLALGFLGVVLLQVVTTTVSVWMDYRIIPVIASKAAEDTARAIAFSLVRQGEATRTPPLFADPAALQGFISDFKSVKKNSLTVVNRHKKIIGGVVPGDVGKVYSHDADNQVTRTIRDGVTRTFVEISPGHPQGIHAIVVPLKMEQGRINGAVIMEYAPLLEEMAGEKTRKIKIMVYLTVICLLIGLGIAFFVSRSVAMPISALKRSVERITQGDMDSPITLKRSDETGDLARAFETMRTGMKDTLERLQTEIRDRKMSAGQLERHTAEIMQLNELGSMLQTCLTAEEAYAIITRYAEKLFPDEQGGVFQFRASRNLLEAVSLWDRSDSVEKAFLPEECLALRLGRVHRVDEAGSGPLCLHIRRPESVGYSLCIPMMAQGETVGILHLAGGHTVTHRPEGARKGWMAEKQQFAVAVAEHVSLALSNMKLRETLHNLSIRDPLTGLFNRRYMEEALERELLKAKRYGRPLGVIMIDIDHFKRFNDTHGHEAGDQVLRELGLFLQNHIRQTDIPCRLGGEEFTLILPEADMTFTQQRAEQLRLGVAAIRVSIHGQALAKITISQGVAVFPGNGQTGEALLRAADEALYRAKQQGRNHVAIAQ